VTEEVLSILKLLRPLSDARLVEPSSSADRLDAGLSQLQHVARSLALSHGNQVQSRRLIRPSCPSARMVS
jgi:hypothetical protein